MIVSSWCQHGKKVIQDGMPFDSCESCGGKERSFFVPNMKETFNQGLGCYTSGTRDAEKKGRKMGLEPIGDTPVEKVFRQEPQSFRKEIIDCYKELKARIS